MAAMVIFAFSCFSLLLFLWISFGGTIPLKPKGYRIHVSFPQATTLADEADVRVSGVSVGRVTDITRDPAGNRTLATIEMSQEFAPIHKDAKAILRQKTLLGETYVEMTLGHKGTPNIPENGTLANAQVQPAVALDEVLKAVESNKLMARLGFKIGDFDLIEINEAFASQGLACLRQLGVADDAEHVNPNGGAIALGHPLGMSGARLALTALHELEKRGGKRALATMCVGVGQGVSLAVERV